MVTQLGERDRQVFDWMKSFFSAHHRMPTIREISKKTVKSLGATQKLIQRLKDKGVIGTEPHTKGYIFLQESPVGIGVKVYARLNTGSVS